MAPGERRSSGRASALRGALAALVPLLLGLGWLWLWEGLFEAPTQPGLAASTGASAEPPVRLLALLVDSLDRRDVEQGRLPTLAARLRQEGLHGAVRACANAITVPCITAMLSGYDRAGSFAVVHNFVAPQPLVRQSVLSPLQARGVRVGYFGERQLADTLRGITRRAVIDEEDPKIFAAGLSAFERAELDLVIIHLRAVDQVAHKSTERSPAYERALAETDQLIARALRGRGPQEHVVVLGDHGHSITGRHVAKLGTQTYAAYLGPRFRRPLSTPMALTDHASIWAALFSVPYGSNDWLTAYFRGDALPPVSPTLHGIAPAAAPARLTLLAILIMVIASWPLLLGTRIALRAGGSSNLLAIGLVVAPPVVMNATGMLVPLALAPLMLGWLAFTALRRRDLPQAATASGVALLCVLMLASVGAWFDTSFLSASWTGALLAALLAGAACAHERGWLAMYAAGVVLTWVLSPFPMLFLAPCALVLPVAMLALRYPRATHVLLLLMPPAIWFFVQGNVEQLLRIASVLLLWTLSSRLVHRAEQTLSAGASLLLVALSLWTTTEARMGGVDFDFYFRWMPHDVATESHALPQALMTAAKVMLPCIAGALLARAQARFSDTYLRSAAQLTTTRIAACLLMLLVLTFTNPTDVLLLSEASQEALFWLLVLSAVGLVSLAAIENTHPTRMPSIPAPRGASAERT